MFYYNKNMQTFEYLFNPDLRPETKFGVFSFKPPDISKKNLGNLYILFELNNALPKDDQLLESLSEIINQEFYFDKKRLPEKSLMESLKKANQFLKEKVGDGNVGWMGNLNMVILNFNDFIFHFSRTGNIRIFLLRSDELSEIEEDIKAQSYSAFKTFSNIVSGRIFLKDKIMILNQSLVENFYDGIFDQLINLPNINEKSLKHFFKEKRQEMKDWSGIFFLLSPQTGEQKLKFLRLFSKINKKLLLIFSLIFLLLFSYLKFKLR